MMDDKRSASRLQFTQEEMDNPALARHIARAEKAADKLEKAESKLPGKRRLVLRIEEQESEQISAGIHHAAEASVQEAAPLADVSAPAVKNTRKKNVLSSAAPALRSSTGKVQPATDKSADVTEARKATKKKVVRLRFEETQKKPPGRIIHPVQQTLHTANDQFHRQVADANEDDNVAVSAVLRADDAGESVFRTGEHIYHAHKLRPYRQAEAAERNLDKANIRYLEARQRNASPRLASNPISRWQQKRAIRKAYADAKAAGCTASHAGQAVRTAETTARKTGRTVQRLSAVAERHPAAIAVIAITAMLLFLLSSLQSCTPLAQSVLESIVIGTYPAEEEDVKAAERAYANLEKQLQDEMDHYDLDHPEYDEVNVDADEIWHDPYVLIAIISAYYDGQDWTIDSAMPVIEKYFELQYIITESVTTQTRYHIETERQYNPETGQMETVTVRIPYAYKICTVRLENKNLSHLPVVSMSHHTMGMYALYMATHGNMEGIFSGNPYAVPLKDPLLYDIPEDTLAADPTFAALMEEAEKYIGYPYVWGGASPETSFDCSGFVSYVFTNSGVYNTGRLGAGGLRSLCRNVPEDQVRPGDVVFFEGTMGEDVGGVTHCGIYVGNNMMIHCGSPIGYANLDDSYWRQHFHSFGRMPGL